MPAVQLKGFGMLSRVGRLEGEWRWRADSSQTPEPTAVPVVGLVPDKGLAVSQHAVLVCNNDGAGGETSTEERVVCIALCEQVEGACIRVSARHPPVWP